METPTRTKGPSRKEKRPIAEPLESRLRSYALAAGAAGVGLLALASPGKADIIVVTENPPITVLPNTNFHFNINGTPVLGFLNAFSASPPHADVLITAPYPLGVAAFEKVPHIPLDRALEVPKGSRIGPGNYFGRYALLAALSAGKPYGWSGTGYLGLRFPSLGETHYAWAKIGITDGSNGAITVNLFGFAYETGSGVPINAGQTTATPEPDTLGLLALGAAGIGLWRKRQKPELENQEPRTA